MAKFSSWLVMIKFAAKGWEDYLYWQTTDQAILKRINQLIRDIKRNPFSGIGKPEALKHQLSGFWSRRIDDKHRLVYAVEQGTILVAQCRTIIERHFRSLKGVSTCVLLEK